MAGPTSGSWRTPAEPRGIHVARIAALYAQAAAEPPDLLLRAAPGDAESLGAAAGAGARTAVREVAAGDVRVVPEGSPGP